MISFSIYHNHFFLNLHQLIAVNYVDEFVGLSNVAEFLLISEISRNFHCVRHFQFCKIFSHCVKQYLVWQASAFQMCNCYKPDSRLALSQWETLLQSNTVSHWLRASLESALCYNFLSTTTDIPLLPNPFMSAKLICNFDWNGIEPCHTKMYSSSLLETTENISVLLFIMCWNFGQRISSRCPGVKLTPGHL